MIATIVNTGTLLKVVLYSLIAGVGITSVFALGVTSAAGMLEAVRRRRSAIGAAWGVLMLACLAVSAAAIVLAIVVMSSKK
jgi:hypothetical protein